MLQFIAKYRLYIISGLLLLPCLLFEAELVRQSPQFARGPLAAISLHNAQRTVFVVGNRLACQEEASAAHCQLTIEPGAVLQIRLQPAPQRSEYTFNYTVACQATFLEQPLHCEIVPAGLIVEAAWPAVIVADAIPVSDTTIARLHRQDLLLNVSEDTWVFPGNFVIGLTVTWLILLWMKRLAAAVAGFPEGGVKILRILFRGVSILCFFWAGYLLFFFQLLVLLYID